MGKFIPNEETYVSFGLTCADLAHPTLAEVVGDSTLHPVDLTPYITGINASSSGNSLPTPSFDTLFETSIPGTSTATFSADFYRDDEDDLAWDTLPRRTSGFIFLARYGGVPIVGSKIEVWPIRVTSRTNANMTNNTVVMFTVTAAVPVEPNEAAVVHA